jgi:hypothetical protein
MADESGDNARLETLKRIAVALEGINDKLEKVVKQRLHPGVEGANAEYWVVVTEAHDYAVK